MAETPEARFERMKLRISGIGGSLLDGFQTEVEEGNFEATEDGLSEYLQGVVAEVERASNERLLEKAEEYNAEETQQARAADLQRRVAEAERAPIEKLLAEFDRATSPRAPSD